MSLPGSEGENDYDTYYYSWAGDALVVGAKVCIILTHFYLARMPLGCDKEE